MTEQCPFGFGANTRQKTESTTHRDWWPNQLNVNILHQNHPSSNPMPKGFDYRLAFQALDYQGLKNDLTALMTDSKSWWPADYGHYGPFFIRMAWHAAGTYRTSDGRAGGRSGSQRFAPLNSWPDNGNLDKARRLLWPIKEKYGRSISWSDLFLLAGNVAIESMGGTTLGFSGGREDTWAPQEDVYWGVEKEWLTSKRYSGDRVLEKPLAAVEMGLIYVNPEGPDGEPDPLKSARDIRETFGRMAMNDEETVALVAGGHTFGKAHGAGDPSCVGPEPEAAPIEAMGLGWLSTFKSGKGRDTITSGIEGSWTPTPIQWDDSYFRMLLDYDWVLTKSPAGAHIWHIDQPNESQMAPDVEDASMTVPIMMTTADMALKVDPEYLKISQHFRKHPEDLADAFARAWFKLLHRDMGPSACYIGPEAPKETFIWQDPVDAGPVDFDEQALRAAIAQSGLSHQVMIETAWASAATFRQSDRRGGANGARIALSPQRDWEAHDPKQLSGVIEVLGTLAKAHGASLADTIVLAGCVGVEALCQVAVPLTKGRGDATQEQTDVASFAPLEPALDAWTLKGQASSDVNIHPEDVLLDKAHQLGLSAPEMTVLYGGLRAMGVGHLSSSAFSKDRYALDHHYFNTILDMNIEWKALGDDIYEGFDRASGHSVGRAHRADLIFGSSSQLRAIVEAYAPSDAAQDLVKDFISAWVKVMNNDRFDVHFS